MTITLRTLTQHEMLKIKAFTVLESLVALTIVSFLTISLSGSVNQIFSRVQESLFFLSFENLYRDTQKLSAIKQEDSELWLTGRTIRSTSGQLTLPETVELTTPMMLTFDQAGGNSSLKKLIFQTPYKEVRYQLYLGNGNFKKTETSRLHSP